MERRLDEADLKKLRLHLEAAMSIAHTFRRKVADEDSIDLVRQLGDVGELLGIELDTEPEIGDS